MQAQASTPVIAAQEAPAVVESNEARGQRLAIIEAFSELVKDKRKAAIEARRALGIEKEWTEDEEHYDGIDNANRTSGQVQKGRTPSDGLRETAKDTTTRSTVFLKITRPYVDAAAARVSDMLLPTDDRNFALRPTPVPELTAMLKDMRPAGPDGKPLAAPLMPTPQPPQTLMGGVRAGISKMFGGEAAAPAQPAQPTVAGMAKAAIDKAKASAERAQEEIDDWLVECRAHGEIRKVIEGAAKVGTGILKGPNPTLTRQRAAKQGPNGWTVEMVQKIAPTSKWINHWNFYPAADCGDDIQKGSGTFECDDLTHRGLVGLKDDPSYIKEAIDACIEEGPSSPTDGTRKRKQGDKPSDDELYQIWYYHGQVSKKDMEAAGCKCSGKELYPALVTMVNDRVIKVTLSPLDSGEYPYDVMVWQAKPGSWAGTGVARQMRECQKGANAAVRNLMDNAGLSAGPQIIVNRNLVVPANGKWEITPRKVWWSKVDEELEDVRKAFTIISIETRQAELMAILQFWLKEAEDVTGLPMLLQGQQGKAPDTVGGMQIMNNNGSTVLRRIARTFDDRITEPHIGRYYEYLLMYGPDEAKGDFTIDARGSSALVERDLQSQQLVQMLGLSLNPAYGLDPELVAKEFLKSLRFDSKGLLLSDEKKEEIAKRPPPEDPRVTAAKIMAKSKEDGIVAGAQMRKHEIDTENENADLDRALEERIAQMDAQLARENLSEERRAQLQDHKVALAGIALKLKTQTDLSLGAHAVDVHKHHSPQVITPAAEPAGRAPAGNAFTQ